MTRVKILPEAVINKIAAGEVVERPSSVVKELLENSLDAGAARIRITVQGGGIKLLRVEDDGEGMERDDLLLALERHSTSKLSSFSDLTGISTLGFRGEAIPSIAGVSRFEVVTRTPESLSATRVRASGGRILEVGEVGAPRGTVVEVRSLFFNTPARRKFLKTPSTEIGHIIREVTAAALARPDVAVRLQRDDEVVLDLPAGESTRERLSSLWGSGPAGSLIPVEEEEEGLSLRGFISPPESSGARRRGLYLFVNGRFIQDRMILSALREGYGPLLSFRRYPNGVLFLRVEGEEVDVNIHPAKREVKFSSPARVRALTVRAIRAALRRSQPVEKYFPPSPEEIIRPVFPVGGSLVREERGLFQSASAPESLPAVAARDFRVLGQIHKTYVVVETPEGMLLIDQHAAHERILYEEFRRVFREGPVEVQTLLAPLRLDLGPKEAALLREKTELLAGLGVRVEPFGRDGFIITALPALLSVREKESLVLEALGEIGDWEKDPADPRESVIIRLSCLAAVKARAAFPAMELEQLVVDLFKCETPAVCPHGRPTILTFSRSELERRFGRR